MRRFPQYGAHRLSLAPQRLLGFAFASADLLLELAPDGRIALAIGASEALSGSAETDLVGRAWRDFIDPRDFPSCWRRLNITVEVEAKAKELAIQRLQRWLNRKAISVLEPG